MWRRKTTGIVALALGILLFTGGLVDHAFAAPRAALCQSGLGQLAQSFDGAVAHDCGLVTALEWAVGWLLVVGVLAVVFGAAVLYSVRSVSQPATSADRSWWTRS